MKRLIARKRVLVVDDESDLRALIRVSIGAEYDVYEAGDGQAAIALAETTRPDAILLDLRLPKANGFVVCRTLKSHPALAKAPIIMVTVPLDDEPFVGLDYGADYFLPKPFTPHALRTLLEVACAGAGCLDGDGVATASSVLRLPEGLTDDG